MLNTTTQSSSLREPVRELLCRYGEPVRLCAGSHLAVQGTPCRAFYVLTLGQVLLSRIRDEGPHASELIGPGELFGEEVITGQANWRHTIRTVCPAEGYRVLGGAAQRLIRQDPVFACTLYELLGNRLAQVETRAIDPTAAALGRARALFTDLALRFGEPENGRLRLHVRVTQAELGQLTGLSRETLARCVGQLIDAGYVQRSGRHTYWIYPE